MTSLVQWFNKSSEYEINGKKLAVKIVGTSEKADDVCKALGYAQYKSSLNDMIN
jgi:hypothetical protein